MKRLTISAHILDLKSVENLDREYTHLHRRICAIKDMEYYQKELKSIKLETYKRKQFSLPMPSKMEIERELHEEAKALNYSKKDVINSDTYVREHYSELITKRQSLWHEANDLFNKIEDAKEDIANRDNQFKYQHKCDYINRVINGDKEAVEQQVQLQISNSIFTPYEMNISYEYDKVTEMLEVELLLVNGINVPTEKAPYDNGSFTVSRTKTSSEIKQEVLDSTFSLIFYVASPLFSASPHIKYIQLSIYDRTKAKPVLWIEFEREKFSKINPNSMNPMEEILMYPHLFETKTRYGSAELVPLTTAQIDSRRRIQQKRRNV